MSEPAAALGAVGQELVAHRKEITDAWLREVSKVPGLAHLPPAAIMDHMPEFLLALARAIAGDPEAARQAYGQLITGHALQRLGFGVEIGTLLEEYAVLRRVLLEHMLRAAPPEGLREGLLAIDRTLDLAIAESVRAFAARRDEVREQFIGMLGHDLRGPLQTLLIAAENILRHPDCGAPGHARAAAAIRRGAERMNRLITDIIDFARGQLGGGIPAVPMTCDMGDLCREAVEELRVAHPDRQLAVTTSGDLVGSWDRDRVVQAIANLASNALTHGRDPITVRVTEAADRQAVTTEVHNPGPPIPEDQLPTLFDAFRRGARSVGDGLGLGLYIVQQIALAHGAACAVRSNAREGTTFSIRWPRAPLSEVPRPYQREA